METSGYLRELFPRLERSAWVLIRSQLMFDAHGQIDPSIDPLPWDFELFHAERSRKLMTRHDMVGAWRDCRIIMSDNVTNVDYDGLSESRRGEAVMIHGIVTAALSDRVNRFYAFGTVGDDKLTTYVFEKQTLYSRQTGNLSRHGLRLIKMRTERVLEVGIPDNYWQRKNITYGISYLTLF